MCRRVKVIFGQTDLRPVPASSEVYPAWWRFLHWMAAVISATVAPVRAAATGAAQCRLAFYNTHTDEHVSLVYRLGADYVTESLTQIKRVLRDQRTDEVWAINLRLFDLLHKLSNSLQARVPFDVISGYRSPLTNATFASRGDGVAKHSLHIEGKAIDIRVRGLDLPQLGAAAIDLRGGGVAYYSRPDFIRVDVGRVRYW